ncbi:MAG: CHRD domain-containing protein [Caldimonas sp.]
MNTRRFALAALVASGAFAFAGCSMMNSSSAKPMMMGNSMTVPLSSRNEVPPNASGGSGSAKVEIDGNVLKWSVTYAGMSGPVTAGHFHGPAPSGANAGVVVPFAGSMASPITGSATLTAAQLADLKAGLYYINLHTAANPGGEIRGQVK